MNQIYFNKILNNIENKNDFNFLILYYYNKKSLYNPSKSGAWPHMPHPYSSPTKLVCEEYRKVG